MNDRVVWIDCEMTGLDLGSDALVEVAALVTDFELNVLGDGVDLVVRPPAEAVTQMPDVVREMHTASGLITQLDSGVSLEEAEQQVLAYIREHVPERTQGTARRQQHRHRPGLPRPGHARARGAGCTTG